MIGMDASTGKALGGIDHLYQSVRNILTTRIGTLVGQRDYGSRLYDLLDAPLNASTRMDIMSATVDALAKWEPRISVQQVSLSQSGGSLAISVSALYLPDGQLIRLDNVVVN